MRRQLQLSEIIYGSMAETIAQRIARTLGERIVRGYWSQEHLSDRTAWQRSSRQATCRHVKHSSFLRAQGLVISEPRRGDAGVGSGCFVSAGNCPKIRASLEGLALSFAGPRMNAACFERIERALDAGDQAKTMIE